jgi:hypothetical protein
MILFFIRRILPFNNFRKSCNTLQDIQLNLRAMLSAASLFVVFKFVFLYHNTLSRRTAK